MRNIESDWRERERHEVDDIIRRNEIWCRCGSTPMVAPIDDSLQTKHDQIILTKNYKPHAHHSKPLKPLVFFFPPQFLISSSSLFIERKRERERERSQAESRRRAAFEAERVNG